MADIRVEVAYATPARQFLVEVALASDGTVREALETSGVLEEFPELDIEQVKTGIFSRPVGLDAPLENGDRVEIYRPLVMDPKEARRQRAKRGASN